MRPRNVVLPVVSAILGGCANINSIYRSIDIGSGSKGQAVALDIKQRAIFSVPRKGDPTFSTPDSVVVCAEPSPDALSAYAAAGGISGFQSSGSPVQGGLATSETSGSVGLRTQSIQLLRDGLFSNCISYMSGALKPAEFYQLQRRSQNFTLGLLAIEQLTGVVKADQVALNTAAGMSTGSDDTEKEESALDSAKSDQNAALKDYEKGKLDLEASRKALSVQQTKVDAADKLVKSPPKDATEEAKAANKADLETQKAALETQKKEAAALKIDVDALARAATNADAKVAAAQSSLLVAQSRVRVAASGTATLAKAGGAAGIVTDSIATAVVNIVTAVLAESGRGEQCNDAIAKLQFLPPDQRAASVALSCTSTEAAAAGALVQTADPNKSNPLTQILEKAIPAAELYRRVPTPSPSKSPSPSTNPSPSPPGPAPAASPPPAPQE